MTKVGFVGTKFAMVTSPTVLNRIRTHGIEVVVPGSPEDRDKIQELIENELGNNIFTQETRDFFIQVFDKMKQQAVGGEIQGIVLGCTEIPLLVKQHDYHLPVFDSTGLHINAAVEVQLNVKSVTDFYASSK